MKESSVEFRSYDGYKLDGTFLHSVSERAVVLFVHGITSSRDELGFHLDYARYLGANGISSFRFDYRYHGVNESDLEALTLCGIVNDIDAAFRVLLNKKKAKTKSVFLIGTSFGGGLCAFWVDSRKERSVRRVLLNAPVINYEDDVLARNGLVEANELAPKARQSLNKKGFVISSGIHFGRGLINELRNIDTIASTARLGDRLTIFHGDKDEDVPLNSSRKYKAKESELRIIKGVGHGFGVDGDEDLDFPQTKAIHKSIYKDALEIFLKCL